MLGIVGEVQLRFRENAIGQSKIRIALHRLFEQFHFLVRTFFPALPIAPDIDFLGLRIVGIGHQIGGRPFRDRGFFRGRQLGLKLLRDLLRDLILNRKYVCDIAIVMLSPKVCIVARID